MKRIQELSCPTPGLEDYLDCDGTDASWEGFRSHRAGAAYGELIEALQDIQHGLCGYCEINLSERDRQIEHVLPQSDPQKGVARALDPTNLIACCKGGTLRADEDDRWRKPARRNRSCGEAKGDSMHPDFVDPRTLPALPSPILVRFDGRVSADGEICANAGIDADGVNRTIEVILGLNVERLRRAREKRWQALSDNWETHREDPRVMEAAAREELLPSDDGDLPRFFTTSRSYFAPWSEEILAEEPQA